MRSLIILHHYRNLAYLRDTGKGKVCTNGNTRSVIVKAAAAIIAASLCAPVTAQTDAGDSITVDDTTCRFRAAQLIAPASLVTVGCIGVCNGWFHSVNNSIRDGMGDLRKEQYIKADDYLQYLPVVANVCLPFVGVKAKHSFKERIAITATAYLAMGIMVNATKRAVGEKRPDTGARNSFPSGHTATAFMGAELVRKEYGTAVGICAYTVATGVAVLRLYNNRHWLNDILAGAGMGILSAKIGFWLLPLERRLFGWDKKGKTAILVPMIDAHGKNLALTFSTSL